MAAIFRMVHGKATVKQIGHHIINTAITKRDSIGLNPSRSSVSRILSAPVTQGIAHRPLPIIQKIQITKSVSAKLLNIGGSFRGRGGRGLYLPRFVRAVKHFKAQRGIKTGPKVSVHTFV